MKLLKAPDPDEPWVALHWVECSDWHYQWWTLDGKLVKESIGPVKLQQVVFEVTKPEPKP